MKLTNHRGLGILAFLVACIVAPSQLLAQVTQHRDDVYVDEKMCIGTLGELQSGDCSITGSSPIVRILRDDESATDMLQLENSGPVRLVFVNSAVGGQPPNSSTWRLNNGNNGFFRISDEDNAVAVTEFELDVDGNLTIAGTLTTAGGSYPDYVFAEDYELMPMAELAAFIEQNRHLPNVPSQNEVDENGGRVNVSELQLQLLEKVEELTLYTLEQQAVITTQRDALEELRERLAKLETGSGSN